MNHYKDPYSNNQERMESKAGIFFRGSYVGSG